MTHEAGKGDTPRPTNMDEFRKNWERIFEKKAQTSEPERTPSGNDTLDEEDRERLREP